MHRTRCSHRSNASPLRGSSAVHNKKVKYFSNFFKQKNYILQPNPSYTPYVPLSISPNPFLHLLDSVPIPNTKSQPELQLAFFLMAWSGREGNPFLALLCPGCSNMTSAKIGGGRTPEKVRILLTPLLPFIRESQIATPPPLP